MNGLFQKNVTVFDVIAEVPHNLLSLLQTDFGKKQRLCCSGSWHHFQAR